LAKKAKSKGPNPNDMTTREALEHLFPKPLRDALEEAVTDVDDPTPDSRPSRRKRPTDET
jgi:hypothetical protein